MAASDGITSLVPQCGLHSLPVLLDIYKSLRRLAQKYLHEGLYEVLQYEATLEILDAYGERAVFRKHHRVKFLQDNVIAYEDYAWGDGDLFADYRCSPGVVVDR